MNNFKELNKKKRKCIRKKKSKNRCFCFNSRNLKKQKSNWKNFNYKLKKGLEKLKKELEKLKKSLQKVELELKVIQPLNNKKNPLVGMVPNKN